MSLIACVFQITKNMVSQMLKKLRLRTPFDSQHAKGSQKLLKSL